MRVPERATKIHPPRAGNRMPRRRAPLTSGPRGSAGRRLLLASLARPGRANQPSCACKGAPHKSSFRSMVCGLLGRHPWKKKRHPWILQGAPACGGGTWQVTPFLSTDLFTAWFTKNEKSYARGRASACRIVARRRRPGIAAAPGAPFARLPRTLGKGQPASCACKGAPHKSSFRSMVCGLLGRHPWKTKDTPGSCRGLRLAGVGPGRLSVPLN
jgi:hypothetical protein